MDLNDLLMGSLQWDIIDLANRLRQERLFVTSEQQHLQELNEKVVAVSCRLGELAWVTAQQRDNLSTLIVARPDCKPAVCCHKANMLENTRFVDGLKVLGFQECLSYGEFLQSLRTSPGLLASCLVVGDRLLPNMMHGIIHSLSAGLFGSSLLPEDKVLVLRLLQHLTRLQLVPSDNPRRLLRKKCCAFARLYGEFHESLFSAKLFLTAALHHPIMQLLVEHDVFLDIDPDKATMRFSPEDREKRFGKEDSPEYPELLLEYRQWTIGRLVVVTSRFLSSLRENMHCFPTGVCWLVRQMASLLSKSGNIQPKEVSAICTDLVFTHFICPAIVDPEPYGITDAPISEIARFNLMQVAKIIQTLAMTKYEEIDPKVLDLYRHFDKDCVSCLLDTILDNDTDELDGPLTLDSNKLQGLSRSAALFTEVELNNLVTFMQMVASDRKENQVDKKELTTLLQQLPSNLSAVVTGTGFKHPASSTPPETPKKITGLLGKVGKSRGRGLVNEGSDDHVEGEDSHAQDVLVIPFSPDIQERVGFLPEHKVLCMKDLGCEVSVNLSGPPQEEGAVEGRGGSGSGGSEEKRSRAHSHDDGSIGNTSDNLEAVSEAASNHSLASSLELETEDQNDNLSDMVSANVSGRGTPNISGRDTPSSQVTEGDEGVGGVRGAVGDQRPLDFRPPSNSKQSRSDIDDKFGKFEIKKLLEGDETVSMVSDTWSTDVLASDSETVEQSESQRLVSDVEVRRPDVSQQLLDVSETASEAWSTDVLTSDTERLTEVDTDDTGSVARSDDTARSEVEDIPANASVSSSLGFRPIREPTLLVPASPTRVEVLGAWNVTGRGGLKADYRRRVVEYVDNNRRDRENQPNFAKPAPMRSIDEARLIHVIDKIDKSAEARFNSVSGSRILPLTPLNANSSTSAATQTNGDLVTPPVLPRENLPLVNGTQPLVNHITTSLLPSTRQLPSASGTESKTDVLRSVEETETVRLSSASLNSTSSSSSGSDPRPNTVTPTPDSNLTPTTVLVNGHSQVKPGVSISTGAIPKSISFDKTAERGDKELLDEDQKHKRGSFFRNFKLPFKNRRGKSLRGTDDLSSRCFDASLSGGDGDMRLRRGFSEDGRCLQDTTDAILAKYRRKPSGDGEIPDIGTARDHKEKTADVEDERLTIDPMHVEESYAFSDAKRKLRMVLSTADLQQRPSAQSTSRENELVLFLQLQLAEAINLQDRPQIAHLHETLRCIRLFDSEGCRKLFHSLKEDYQSRAPYINYLVRCRQGLLSTLAHLDRLMERVKSDQEVCSRFLVAVCVRMFLERHDSVAQNFITEFQQLTLADEKIDLLDSFLHQLASDMEHDPTWQVANEAQLQQARMAVERAMMSRLYMNALYPNGDGDVSRDQVLHEHMAKLSQVITPNHKDLRIPSRFQYECPWASAQAEVSAIAAYKTPRDKLQCILRCSMTIMNLLAMAAGIPAADDFTPVLVFVLIKANPPALLSTIQYIDSFYANRLEGEDQYWWTQFCSAVEFIKTMDYTD